MAPCAIFLPGSSTIDSPYYVVLLAGAAIAPAGWNAVALRAEAFGNRAIPTRWSRRPPAEPRERLRRGSCRGGSSASGLSASVVQRISERGARMARRDDRDTRIPGVSDGGATPPAGMPRPKGAVQMTRTGHLVPGSGKMAIEPIRSNRTIHVCQSRFARTRSRRRSAVPFRGQRLCAAGTGAIACRRREEGRRASQDRGGARQGLHEQGSESCAGRLPAAARPGKGGRTAPRRTRTKEADADAKSKGSKAPDAGDKTVVKDQAYWAGRYRVCRTLC
jgi:hypothetical protein